MQKNKSRASELKVAIRKEIEQRNRKYSRISIKSVDLSDLNLQNTTPKLPN